MGHISYKLLIMNRFLAVFWPGAVSTRPQRVLIIGMEEQISSANDSEKVAKPELGR
jgi:hypothetical protein